MKGILAGGKKRKNAGERARQWQKRRKSEKRRKNKNREKTKTGACVFSREREQDVK